MLLTLPKASKSIWIHSERTNKETIAKRVSHFTEIKKLNYLSQVNPQQEIQEKLPCSVK